MIGLIPGFPQFILAPYLLMNDNGGVGPWISSIYYFPYSLGKGFELESVMLDCGIKYLRAESACLDHIKKKYSIKRAFM
jgi:hypothetical protein